MLTPDVDRNVAGRRLAPRGMKQTKVSDDIDRLSKQSPSARIVVRAVRDGGKVPIIAECDGKARHILLDQADADVLDLLLLEDGEGHNAASLVENSGETQ